MRYPTIWLLGVFFGLAGCEDYSRAGSRPTPDTGQGGAGAGASASASASAGASAGAGAAGGSVTSSTGGDLTSGALPDSVRCDAPGAEEPPVVGHELMPTDEDFPNPERGFHADNPLPQSGLADYRAQGFSLMRSYVVLSDFRTQPISSDFLEQLKYSFQLVREGGLKLVLRFAYNDDGTDDAPLATVLQHLTQLKPLLQQNADVIAVVQAGFMGRWGEWHHSKYGLNTQQNRQTIVQALLDAVPASRMVQLRYPWQRKQLFPTLLTEATAYSGMGGARVGHHNDCFLTSSNDLGTYGDFVDEATGSAPDDQVTRWMDYTAQESRFTATGAETCQNTDRSSCAHAKTELSRLHYSYLNAKFHEAVNARWETEGCMPEIKRRLGYRFELGQVSMNERVAPGGVLRIAFSITNRGYAAPFNARKMYVVLDGGARLSVPLTADVRGFLPEKAAIKTSALLRIPATLAPGKYRVALWLPDADEALSSRPEYAIRFANAGAWNAEHGDNSVGTLEVDAAAGGCADSSTTKLEQLF
jgi:Domain of unknown function (DUF4832)/Domain of unknown function (DUF4874)